MDDNLWQDCIFESAIATPTSVEENIQRGMMAMKHVISSHKIEPHAMYRKDIGWIGFEWGETGEIPPEFASHEEFRKWQKSGRRPFDKGGHGLAHIIAKRDWEGKYIEEFLGQNGIDVANRLVIALARGKVITKGAKTAKLNWKNIEVFLAKRKDKYNEYWLITGYLIPENKYRYVPQKTSSGAIFERAGECASVTDHTTHLRMNDLHGFVQTWERQAQLTGLAYQNQQDFCKCNGVDESEIMRRIWAGGYF